MSQGFAPNHAAVVSIDLQNDYRAGANWPVAGFDQVLAKAAAVIEGARGAGVPVVHVQAWRDPARGMGPPSQDKVDRDLWLCGIAGTPGAEICPEVAPRTDEPVVRKCFASGFRDSDLDRVLKDLAVRQLMVVGVWSDMCVRGTVLDGVDLGYRIWLVKDACGSANAHMHQTAVIDMANRLYGGWISDTATALRALAGRPAEAWQFTAPVAFPFTADSVARHYAQI